MEDGELKEMRQEGASLEELKYGRYGNLRFGISLFSFLSIVDLEHRLLWIGSC